MRYRSCTECKYRFFSLSHPWCCSDLLVQYAPGLRIIIDAALLSPARMASDTSGPWDVAILPGMRLGPTDGVQVINPLSGYEVLFDRCADYATIQYKDEGMNRGKVWFLFIFLNN